VTVPVGVIVPVPDFTETVNSVLALWAMVEGLAVTVVVVATGGGVTVTAADPDELVKLPEAR
jgi:hypothetical protein